MTNGDKIRSMTDEELVDNFFVAENPDIRLYPTGFCLAMNDDDEEDGVCYDDCRECFVNYLKQEVIE